MAELIPLEYRLQVARRRLISRWTAVGIVAVAAVGSLFISTYLWKRQQSATVASLQRTYNEKAVSIKQYNDLKAKREDLAQRMRKMENLRDDFVLLSLLHNVSGAFGESDCLQYLAVDAYPPEKKNTDAKYSVRVRGVTRDDLSHSRLLDRLTDIGKKSNPPLYVPLGEKHLQIVLEGQVTSFDIICDQPLVKGN